MRLPHINRYLKHLEKKNCTCLQITNLNAFSLKMKDITFRFIYGIRNIQISGHFVGHFNTSNPELLAIEGERHQAYILRKLEVRYFMCAYAASPTHIMKLFCCCYIIAMVT